MLADDAPYAFDLRGEPYVAELRANVVETLETLYRAKGVAPDCGPVTVRAAMRGADALQRAQDVLADLSAARRADVQARVDEFIRTRYSGSEPRDAAVVRAYRALQELGLIVYRTETIDPRSYLTPTQQEILDSQTRSPRPTPHLRMARLDAPSATLGWLYRDAADGKWALDFSKAREARELSPLVAQVLTELDPDGVPRVARDKHGRPRRDDEGNLVFDGVIALDGGDPIELLRSVQAFVEDKAYCELVP